MSREAELSEYFPGLRSGGTRITSPATVEYNCIAWAAGDDARWWWPDVTELGYWPEAVIREESIKAFVMLFASLGFTETETSTLESGVEKIALFGIGTKPTHAARQLPNGVWTSKLGPWEDIEHSLQALTGDVYGEVVRVFRRSKRWQQ